jgi:hypothetical protein
MIPQDQAIANKALAISLQGITGISSLTLSQLAKAVGNVQTTANLPLVSALTEPVSPAAANVILSTVGTGTGQNGTVTIDDMLGTAAGYVSADALTNSVAIINSMTMLGSSANANSLIGIYTYMADTVNGVFGDPKTGPVVIPDGPAANTYGNADSALTDGLIPSAQSAVANIVAADPTDTTQLNSNWANIITQLSLEKTNQAKANLDFTQLTPNNTSSIYSLVFSLPQYGEDTAVGGMAQFIQAIADTSNLGGEAIIAVMRQGQTKLGTTGISSNSQVPAGPATPPQQAQLIPAQYPYPPT